MRHPPATAGKPLTRLQVLVLATAVLPCSKASLLRAVRLRLIRSDKIFLIARAGRAYDCRWRRRIQDEDDESSITTCAVCGAGVGVVPGSGPKPCRTDASIHRRSLRE